MKFEVTEGGHAPYHKGQIVSPKDSNLHIWRGRSWARPVRGGQAETATTGPEENAALEPLGGGYYQLPDGRKVQGRDAALEALEALEGDE